jgi:hypothetical protein
MDTLAHVFVAEGSTSGAVIGELGGYLLRNRNEDTDVSFSMTPGDEYAFRRPR